MEEQANLVLVEIEEAMNDAISALNKELASIRTGRANPAILDKITIDYYGAVTPLPQIASISVVEGTQLLITPYDKGTIKAIEHSISASDIGITPQSDNSGIRLILPALNEQRRKDLSKDVDRLGEESKVNIRNARRDGNDSIESLKLSEDFERNYLEEVQKLTDKYVEQIDQITKGKVKEIMTI